METGRRNNKEEQQRKFLNTKYSIINQSGVKDASTGFQKSFL